MNHGVNAWVQRIPSCLIGLAALAMLLLGPDVERASAELTPRPNFLIILADDAGFSDTGMYGGEIETRVLDRLAEDGLRFTSFYSTGRCWPSRAALLTGYYAQQIRMDPVRREYDAMPPWARMLPQYLKHAGYRSYHSGKWHVHLEGPLAGARFARSYEGVGAGRVGFFYPDRHFLDEALIPSDGYDEDYYSTIAMADYAIQFLQEHQTNHPDDPWFVYYAPTAPHWPLHALTEDIATYEGHYDEGWDVIRRERLKRMKRMGLFDTSMPLPPLEPEVVPAWNSITRDMEPQFGRIREREGQAHLRVALEDYYGEGEVGRAVPWVMLTPEQQRFQAMKMEIHAAMMDRMDQEIGRIIAQIEAMGDRENTVIIYMSDNGASPELLAREGRHEKDARPGSAETYLAMGPGWSSASNTPFRLHKHWTHEGGTASPLIINWPAGISESARGGIRHTPGHFVDILPTLLELAGVTLTDRPAGAPPFPGRSLVSAFEDDVRIERDFIFFAHTIQQRDAPGEHRALRVGDWKIVSRVEQDHRWKLYNLACDRNELNDLAAHQPERVRRMSELWHELNARYERQATRR